MNAGFKHLLKAWSLIIAVFVTGASLSAQDIHFTHFRMAPVSLNPAMTGSFKGTYRISGIYRDQWRPIDNSRPFRTPFASAEINLKAGLLTNYDWIAGAISFVSDRSGTYNFKHQLTAMNVAYHLGMDRDYNDVWTIGLSYGTGTRGFEGRELTTPNSLINNTPGVAFPIDQRGNVNRNFTDLSLGLAYKTITDAGMLMRFGVNAAHLNRPFISLAQQGPTIPIDPMNPPPPPPPGGGQGNRIGERLGMRMTMHGEASFLASKTLRINPAVLFQTRQSFYELALQGTADYLLNPKTQTVVTGGLGYRTSDAIQLIGGIQIKELRVGISYDVTTSSLANNAGGGAFELAVGYVGSIFKTPDAKPVIFCPRL